MNYRIQHIYINSVVNKIRTNNYHAHAHVTFQTDISAQIIREEL